MHKCRMREKKIKKKAQHTDRKFGVPPMNVNLPNVSIYTIVCIMLLYVCIKWYKPTWATAFDASAAALTTILHYYYNIIVIIVIH